MLVELQIPKDKGRDDTDDLSKQNTLLSHLDSLFPSCWCVFSLQPPVLASAKEAEHARADSVAQFLLLH